VNLADAPTHKIADRREILNRVLDRLLASPDCRAVFNREWKPLNSDESANWEARTTISNALFSLPPSTLPVDLPLETLSTEE
jgi:hypothetical protein